MIKRILAAVLFAGVVAAGFATGVHAAEAKANGLRQGVTVTSNANGLVGPQLNGPENEL